MRMRDDDAPEVGKPLLDEADIGQHEVDTRQFRRRECHAAIDDDPLAAIGRAVAVEREVHADLADPA